jgi:hypothetical protein
MNTIVLKMINGLHPVISDNETATVYISDVKYTNSNCSTEYILSAKLTVTHLVKQCSTSVELKGSLPCPEQSVTGFFPKPDESFPPLQIFLYDPF